MFKIIFIIFFNTFTWDLKEESGIIFRPVPEINELGQRAKTSITCVSPKSGRTAAYTYFKALLMSTGKCIYIFYIIEI